MLLPRVKVSNTFFEEIIAFFDCIQDDILNGHKDWLKEDQD